jgi:hypothetical protein
MSSETKINITKEDLSQAYASGFADGSIVRDETVVSAEQYEKLQRSFTQLTTDHSDMLKVHASMTKDYNRLADAIVRLQSIRDTADKCPSVVSSTDAMNSSFGVLDALGEVSPF